MPIKLAKTSEIIDVVNFLGLKGLKLKTNNNNNKKSTKMQDRGDAYRLNLIKLS